MEANGPPPLSLKVMRVSRPSLASQWQPFFSSSPSFSAHATANVLSLQGTQPLPGHPKTLRDLTHAGQMLTLPASFGAIQLGETFSCCLCVNNDSSSDVYDATIKIEMQTATSKVLLDEVGGPGHVLSPSDTLEAVVTHEVKELGQHVLACTVSYRAPTPPGSAPNPLQDHTPSFRKFYKFAVTNPLSVKTKVHSPSSPSALLSREEREKVFLEVQIQNLMQGAMWVERIRLVPIDGWVVENENLQQPSSSSGARKSAEFDEVVFGGNMALMHPQDVRQYIYVLSPMPSPEDPRCVQPTLPAGTVIPLGRLDIVWRSSMGEPGRLITSPLTRRIPVSPQPSAPSNAAPATVYRQRTQTQGSGMGSGPPSRAQSPHPSVQLRSYQHPSLQRVASPPPRPSSPLRRDSAVPSRPGSPKVPLPQDAIRDAATGNRETVVPENKALSVNVDLTVISGPVNARAVLARPFDVKFVLVIAGSLPQPTHPLDTPGIEQPPRHRMIRLAVQHILPPKSQSLLTTGNTGATSIDNLILQDAFSSLIGTTVRSGNYTPRSNDVQSLPSPLSAGSTSTTTLVRPPSRTATLRQRDGLPSSGLETHGVYQCPEPVVHGASIALPSPYSHPLYARKGRPDATGRISPIGPSLLILPPLHLTPHTHPYPAIPSTGATPAMHDQPVTHGSAGTEFKLTYMPEVRGFAELGGLRILLVRDQELEGRELQDAMKEDASGDGVKIHTVRILRTWDVVGEVWVQE